MIKVECRMPIYQKNDERVQIPEKEVLIVESTSDRDLVTVIYGGFKLTVVARDLLSAITAATTINKSY